MTANAGLTYFVFVTGSSDRNCTLINTFSVCVVIATASCLMQLFPSVHGLYSM